MHQAVRYAVSLLVLLFPVLAPAGAKEDVAAATRAWIDAMTSHDVDRVLALYDTDAVVWGTRSPKLADNREAIRTLQPRRDAPVACTVTGDTPKSRDVETKRSTHVPDGLETRAQGG